MKILWQYLKPSKYLVILVVVLSIVNSTFSLLDPIIFGKLIGLGVDYEKNPDSFTYHSFFFKYPNSVLWLVLASIGVAMVSRIAKNFQDYFLNVVIQKFGATIFTNGLKHSMRLPYQEFEDQRSGETLSILTKVRTDTEKFMSLVVNVLIMIIVGIVMISVYAANFHWSLPLVYFGGMAILFFVSNRLSKKIKFIQKDIVSRTTALAGATTESLRNIELVKSLGLTNQEVDRLNKNTFKILGLELTKVKKIRSISFLQGTLVNTLRQVIMFILMYLLYHKDMAASQLATMQIYSFFLFGPLQEIGNIILARREAEASLNNFDSLMRKAPEAEPQEPKPLGNIETLNFENISFKHKTAKHNAIENISFNVAKGQTVAFVGPSGSGKTTLMKLLVGLYKPQLGSIKYNDIPSSEIAYSDLREQLGFVTQDTQLFSGSIKENLLFVNPSATDADLHDALEKASCSNLLVRAEHGIDTVIGEGGLKLSGGEKQRLSIARSLLRKPKLLIFDEATSALDSLTEEEITNTIKNISNSKQQITILIAHRLSTIMHADTIFVLEKGSMIEIGKHEDLLAEKGLYYAMWRQQIGERKN
jgi:ATP-binding cassette, subfamily B, bacterial